VRLIKYDVIIIGAGQAGLFMGNYLQQTNLSFLILDKRERIGEVWRNRYNSLNRSAFLVLHHSLIELLYVG
jgi:cation diffusion facilitator CzcD-associated flavoprotein CzcO